MNNRGPELPLYANYTNWSTAHSTDGYWHKIFDIMLQDDPKKLDAKDANKLSLRSLKRLFLTALVYDGTADKIQETGFLNLQIWIDGSGDKGLKAKVSLGQVTKASQIGRQMEFRVYWKRTDLPETVEYNVQLWGRATPYWSRIAIHPVHFDTIYPVINPYSEVANYHSNSYERLNALFANIGEVSVTDEQLAELMRDYQYVRTDDIVQSEANNNSEVVISSEKEVINVGSSGSGVKKLEKVKIADEGDYYGKRIRIINWNNVVLKNGGSVQSHDADVILCPGGKDYQMKISEMVELIRHGNCWFLLGGHE
ncbi:hypothetical protein [Ligilactobacillus murinus]|uniref:hypothetical protein n=1 Tax=Ligilactobacillus murinus TaxID=1622 RepID=UPI003513960D